MPVDETPRVAPQPAPNNTIAPDRKVDDIVSVNDTGRRQGGKVGPFVMLGGVALVVLVGLLLTVQVIKSKMTGPKPVPVAQNGTSAGLARSFDTESAGEPAGAPPLPGQTAATTVGALASGACPDGTAGNELKGRDGVVVRNASGQAVRVCANGQVVGVTPAQEAGAQPIPVERTSRGASPRSSGSGGLASVLQRGADGQMMLNDGKYGSAPLVQDLTNPQAVLSSIAAESAAGQPKTEGLLTSAPANSLEAQLTPSKTPMVEAAKLNDLNLLLPKGHTIDCGMSMRIISSLAGQASCILTSNVYSANGKVVLLPRGSEAVGEYRSGASIGQKRLFVLWTRIITPDGVVINLDSPGADELGSTGLTGKVDSHWFERIGSAFLLSTVQDGIQYEIAEQQAKSGGSTLVLSNTAQTGDSMAQKVLESTINIPPTILKNQGDRAIIYVARDLDFSHVYKLRPNS
jgi:type IV secretion system protein VirB10